MTLAVEREEIKYNKLLTKILRELKEQQEDNF